MPSFDPSGVSGMGCMSTISYVKISFTIVHYTPDVWKKSSEKLMQRIAQSGISDPEGTFLDCPFFLLINEDRRAPGNAGGK